MISINNLLRVLTLISLLGVNNIAYNQCNRYTNAQKDGLIIREKSCFKKFAILLQDTCTEYNRFTNNLIHPSSIYDTLTLTSIIVEEALFIKTELFLCENSKKLSSLKSHIRLYIGCIDNNNDTCIIVQFVKEKEFNNDKRYLKQMNLILGGNNPLYVAYFALKNDELVLLRETIPPDERSMRQ